MNVLVINCGSSSLKASLINVQAEKTLHELKIEQLFTDASLTIDAQSIPVIGRSTKEIIEYALKKLTSIIKFEISAIAHRVVHGGDLFKKSCLIDKEVLEQIRSLIPLAPLHNPTNLLGIEAAMQCLPDLPNYAVFDTAFHQTMPKRAVNYAIPKDLAEKHQIKRFGFHGSSHAYVAQLAADQINADLKDLRIITCHLGNGASICAVEYGRSIDTSMGFTPLEGLAMGSRCGDIDAGILLHLMRAENMDAEQLDDLLNRASGLKGLSGGSSDMRDIIERSTHGDNQARLALQVFTHRIKKYIGAYAAIMGGVDVIVFTGGIGENSAVVRHRCCQRLNFLGALIDEDKNHDVNLSNDNNVQEFHLSSSRVKLMAIRTNEQLKIAQEASKLMQENAINVIPTIPIAVSARHIHLTQEAVDVLFGKGYQLTQKALLSQPGQFACNEVVTIHGPKNKIEHVRILGPVRPKDQLEISRTDEFYLGIDAPVRASGKVANSPGIKLSGPEGDYFMKEGVICAWRHIHMTPEDAKLLCVEDKDIVDVAIKNGIRPLTFGNVLVRVSPKYKLEMHIDTDEANAAELSRYSEGILSVTQGEASLIRKM